MKNLALLLFGLCFGLWIAYHFNFRTSVNKFDRIVNFTWSEIKSGM